MQVGLALERQVEIGRPPQHQSHAPFQPVPQIEEDKPHLDHLPGVYALMVHQHGRYDRVRVAEQHAEKVDGGIVLARNEPVPDDFHPLLLFVRAKVKNKSEI